MEIKPKIFFFSTVFHRIFKNQKPSRDMILVITYYKKTGRFKRFCFS